MKQSRESVENAPFQSIQIGQIFENGCLCDKAKVEFMAVRDTVMKSLRAIGSSREAKFYAEIFQKQQAERFALIVVDPRCLKQPLLEALTSDLKILADLGLTPVLLVGDEKTDQTQVKFQSQKLCKALDMANIANAQINCASYQVMMSVRNMAKAGRFVVLELMRGAMGHSVGPGDMNLKKIMTALLPAKVIFLRPSGGFRKNGKRVEIVDIDRIEQDLDPNQLEAPHIKFIEMVKELTNVTQTDISKNQEMLNCTFVMASPLNLLAELFTVRGAGTLLRRGAVLSQHLDLKNIDEKKLITSMENAFEKPLVDGFLTRPIQFLALEENYRGGALVTELGGKAYLSKFWVTREAQGEGIARDIWQNLQSNIPAFFWRSREGNAFNPWYVRACDGMQNNDPWRVFWSGLAIRELENAIESAVSAPVDFKTTD